MYIRRCTTSREDCTKLIGQELRVSKVELTFKDKEGNGSKTADGIIYYHSFVITPAELYALADQHRKLFPEKDTHES